MLLAVIKLKRNLTADVGLPKSIGSRQDDLRPFKKRSMKKGTIVVKDYGSRI